MEDKKQESIDFYVALVGIMAAFTNIVLMIIKSDPLFSRPFSIGVSVFLFYYAWTKITELETYKKMKMLLFVYHLEKEAIKEAKKVIEDVKKES